MRSTVNIGLGGKEYPLLPTYGVWSDFEDQAGVSLLSHVHQLYDGTALIGARSKLILLGLRAADESAVWEIDRVKQAMFERGAWHESLIGVEADFAQTLMFTPEQYAEKKAQREAHEKQQQQAEAELTGAFSQLSSGSLL